ncbi:MAG: MarR family transcriptional regulator [Rhizobiales bacterium]|nr:MarR family transcriptional regulator [Hyphomicrobiales bacterium]
MSIDAETKAAQEPGDHRAELRLWLRLLTCTKLIENEVRGRLRRDFDFTLSRFDLLAQLDKAGDGLVLGEVSKRLMVSPGNVTSLVERLIESGHISRSPSALDGRMQIIRLTDKGRREFRRMARAHGDWIGAMFRDLSPSEIDGLMQALANLKQSVLSGIADRRHE